MVRSFSLKEEENNAKIMTITSPLLERKEMVPMVILFPLEEKEENVMIMTIAKHQALFWKRERWWPWSYHSLLKQRRRM